MRTTVLKSVRAAFLSGLVLLAPIGVTLLVFGWLVEQVGGSFREYFFFFVPGTLLDKGSLIIVWNFLATTIVLLLITALGFLSRFLLGRYFGTVAEKFIRSVPVINTVYSTVKQIVQTFSAQNRALFSKAVLIEFPRKGLYSIGFLTNKARGEPQAKTAEEVWTVFIPTTPNPTTGFLVMLPRCDIIELQMSVGDGMKMIISGGTVVPPWGEQAVPVANPAEASGSPVS